MGSVSLVAAYAAYFVIPLLFLLSYRIFFHPLRGYPGPVLAKITNGYAGWHAICKNHHLATYQNFQRFGPVVRQGPTQLVFNTATAFHDIYLNPKLVKGHAYHGSQLTAKYPSVINAIDKDQARRKRKVMGQALTERYLRAFEPMMSGEVDVFLRQLLVSSKTAEVVNMTPRCERLGLDIIGLLSFGYRFNTQTDESHRYLQPVIDGMAWRMNTYMLWPILKPFEKLFMLLGAKKLLRFRRLVHEMIRTRMAEEKDAHHDLYSSVADQVGKGQEGLYDGELWPEAILFILAGGSTTAAAMSAAFFYLSRNPAAYSALAAEVRSTFKSGREICAGAQLNGCTYLRACIDETMRMSPPATSTSWRQLNPKNASSGDPWIVDGHVVPPGTQVGVHLYSLFHNEDYFPDSYTWKPERWLDQPASETTQAGGEAPGGDRATKMRKAFQPFLAGERSCLGKSMAYVEISLTLARTIWYFDFETAPGAAGGLGAGQKGRKGGRGRTGEYQLYDIFTGEHDGPNLVFRPRMEVCGELEAEV
ncbi:cytochrome P450 [Apiospora sp. TS-2023a]